MTMTTLSTNWQTCSKQHSDRSIEDIIIWSVNLLKRNCVSVWHTDRQTHT